MSYYYKRKNTSYGIACCRKNPKTGEYEILTIKKRYTYAFKEFIEGVWSHNKNKLNTHSHLIALFNKMTYEEKLIINSLDFDRIWYHYKLEIPKQRHNSSDKYVAAGRFDINSIFNKYITKKRLFEDTFLVKNDGHTLISLINNSKSNELIWEIPKGHKDTKQESGINTAIREFSEETNIYIKHYNILFDYPPVLYSFEDGGVIYNSYYFIALVKDHRFEPHINFRNYKQIYEVLDIKYKSIKDISMLDKSGRLKRVYKQIINCIKDYKKFDP